MDMAEAGPLGGSRMSLTSPSGVHTFSRRSREIGIKGSRRGKAKKAADDAAAEFKFRRIAWGRSLLSLPGLGIYLKIKDIESSRIDGRSSLEILAVCTSIPIFPACSPRLSRSASRCASIKGVCVLARRLHAPAWLSELGRSSSCRAGLFRSSRARRKRRERPCLVPGAGRFLLEARSAASIRERKVTESTTHPLRAFLRGGLSGRHRAEKIGISGPRTATGLDSQ